MVKAITPELHITGHSRPGYTPEMGDTVTDPYNLHRSANVHVTGEGGVGKSRIMSAKAQGGERVKVKLIDSRVVT